MELVLGSCLVRTWDESDASSLATHGNSLAVWRTMRDAFPRPFTLERAVSFISAARSASPETRFAICVDGEAVGAIGFTLHHDVERISAELGYWLGERHWGQGIMSEVIAAITPFAIQAYELERIYALPYANNPGSARVLEKAGYVLEGRMRRGVIKEGVVHDQLMYAFVINA